MQQHGSKRKKIALRFFSYGVMTLATVIFSFICILLILGYQFDLQKGTVEQGGLIQFRSFPSSATIRLDERTLSFKTPGKENVPVGAHSVVMSKSGYHDWLKSFPIKAGELRWLNYGRLIPTTIQTQPIRSFDALTASLPSPNRDWFALQASTAEPSLTIADIQDRDNVTFEQLPIPESVRALPADNAPSTFTLKEWDFGARYILVQRNYADQVEFIRLDRTNAGNARNITTQFKLPISDIHFSGTSGNVFYGLVAGDIRKFDLQAGTISEPLATNVNQFMLYKSDVIAYSATREDKFTAGVIIDNKATVVKSYDTTTPLHVDISEYFDNYYLAIARGEKTEVIKDPVDYAGAKRKPFATTTLAEGATWVKFSSSGRFVVTGNGNHYVTRDLETAETFTTALSGTSQDLNRPLQWLDDYYLVSDAESSVRIAEFDGTNQHIIAPSAPGYKVTLSDDGEYLYSIVKKETGYTLQASRLVLP